MFKKTIPEPSIARLESEAPYARNHLLLDWLSDDIHRARLYEVVNDEGKGQLAFPSCAGTQAGSDTGHAPALLITRRDLIEQILLNKERAYSSKVYSELGDDFMLALDPWASKQHAAQRSVFQDCFPRSRLQIAERSHAACQAAAVAAFQGPGFDLASYALQSALRFCQMLMGYALKDFLVLERVLSASYQALVYQVMGRHFSTDPLAIVEAKQAMGGLLLRTSQLIDAYRAGDTDALTGCDYQALPNGFEPVLLKLARDGSDMNGEQRAVLALGAAVGTVGNVQAAACTVIRDMFAQPDLMEKAMALVAQHRGDEPLDERAYQEWKTLVQDSLRRNPPIPFLPRTRLGTNGEADQDVLLALGGGTATGPGGDDPLVWGLPPPPPHCRAIAGPGPAAHWCAGNELAWPLIVEIVRQVVALPNLAQALDPHDARPIGLKKRWGFICESYPLTYRRDKRIVQTSLNVTMPLKAPTQQSAAGVRDLIRAGAPRIEQALRDARQVHFAWFELIDNDSTCVLHTVYDGPFDAYIQDFALKVGDLFDLLFDYLEARPPGPVRQFPNEFVALIKLFDRPPASGYFFSAYPGSDTARITRDALARP